MNLRSKVVLAAIALHGGVALADDVGAAPPPTAMTCKAVADCPAPSVCTDGACVIPDPIPAADVEAARIHFGQGFALYNTGDYSGALAEFQESYKRNKVALVLKNIGLCQKALFRYSDAIDSLQQYLADSRTFPPVDPAETRQILAEMKALLADVILDVLPAGAVIAFDGRRVGIAPLVKPVQLAAGTHALEVTAEHYESQKRDIIVAAGVPMTLKLALVAIPTKGKVRISSPITSAMVSIDGKAVGLVPLEVELDGGGHTLEIAAVKYRTYRGDLTISPGQTREMSIPLDRELVAMESSKPWYMNKVLWGAAAGVVVVGVTLGIVFGTHESPIDGTLNPGVGKVP